jgi:osmotically-inducible protein OsmY
VSQSAALVVLPATQPGDDESKATQAVALLLAQSLVDLCLAERVERALRAAGYPPLRAVEVTVCDGLVLLQGCVPSYYMKQHAQAAALDVPGVRALRNDLQVVRSA